MWNQHLAQGRKKIWVQPSAADECVFYKGNTTLFCCIEDGTFVGPNHLEIDKCVKDIIQLKHGIEESSDIEHSVGINFGRKEENTIKLSQPHVIQQIIDEISTSPRLVDKENTSIIK